MAFSSAPLFTALLLPWGYSSVLSTPSARSTSSMRLLAPASVVPEASAISRSMMFWRAASLSLAVLPASWP